MKRSIVATLVICLMANVAMASSAGSFSKELDKSTSYLQFMAQASSYDTRKDHVQQVAQNQPEINATKREVQQAYKAYVKGRGAKQVRAAKHLYAAWLTMADAIGANGTDAGDLASTPAGTAYLQALNEFKIDSGD